MTKVADFCLDTNNDDSKCYPKCQEYYKPFFDDFILSALENNCIPCIQVRAYYKSGLLRAANIQFDDIEIFNEAGREYKKASLRGRNNPNCPFSHIWNIFSIY